MANHNSEEIQKRAYSLWEKEGRPEGKHAEHWKRAEHELQSHAGQPNVTVPINETSTKVDRKAKEMQPQPQPKVGRKKA